MSRSVEREPPRVAPRVRRRIDAGRLRLWPILAVLPLSFVIAVAGLAGLAWAAMALLHYPPIVPAAFRKLDDVAVLTGPSLPVLSARAPIQPD